METAKGMNRPMGARMHDGSGTHPITSIRVIRGFSFSGLAELGAPVVG